MQLAKQVSVSLVNKPGRLAATLAALSKEKVDFRALSVMDSSDRGTVRFVPDDAVAAAGVLNKLNVRHDVCDVLLLESSGANGAFRNICERLAAEHLNIDYAYCSGGNVVVIKVNDLNKAQKILQTSGGSRKKLPGRRPVHAR